MKQTNTQTGAKPPRRASLTLSTALNLLALAIGVLVLVLLVAVPNGARN